jgi:hypothetical protein
VANTRRPDAVTGIWPFTAGVRIVSGGSTPTDETVTVHWWYSTGGACRYRVGYLVQGQSCSLSATTPAPNAQAHAAASWISRTDDKQHIAYVGSNNHVYELYMQPGGAPWTFDDATNS